MGQGDYGTYSYWQEGLVDGSASQGKKTRSQKERV